MPISICSKPTSFRRCGRTFTQAGEDYPDEAFTDEELAQLNAEPMLVVTLTGTPEGSGKSGKNKRTTGSEA